MFIGHGNQVNVSMQRVVLGRRHAILNSSKLHKGLPFFLLGEQFSRSFDLQGFHQAQFAQKPSLFLNSSTVACVLGTLAVIAAIVQLTLGAEVAGRAFRIGARMARAVLFDSDRKMWRAMPRLLTEESQREQIAHCGHERALHNNLFNEPMLAAVIERAVRAFEEMR